MEPKQDPEISTAEKESLSASENDLEAEVTKKPIEKRLRIMTLVLCLVTVITTAAFALEFKNRRHACPANRSKLQENQSRYQSSPRKEQEHIEVIGDGNNYILLTKGSKLTNWKILTMEGHIYLRSNTFIVMQVPGIYRVYGQYTVYEPNRNRTDRKIVNVMLMKNWTSQSTSIVEQCRTVCTRSFVKTIKVKKGDHLSLQSGTGGTFLVSPKFAYFGVVKIN